LIELAPRHVAVLLEALFRIDQDVRAVEAAQTGWTCGEPSLISVASDTPRRDGQGGRGTCQVSCS